MLLHSVDLNFSGGIRWKPINNYPAFAGFPAAGTNFSFVTPSYDGQSILFGGIRSSATSINTDAVGSAYSIPFQMNFSPGGTRIPTTGYRKTPTVALPGAGCYALVASATPSSAGHVNVTTAPNCAGGYASGSVVGITATPGDGYDFVGWSATNCQLGSPSMAATVCTMSGANDASVVAAFSARQTAPPRRRAVGRR
jgi:hypothetical protein